MTSDYWQLIVVMTTIFQFSTCQEPVQVDLQEFLQPDDVDEYYQYSTDPRSCTRECVEGGAPRICYYKFVLEDYASLTVACGNCLKNQTACSNKQCITADGYERGVISVNRRIPGPAIQVCYGDRVIVDVINAMLARTTTIHWHGVFQKGTPYSDGVPGLTQCPVIGGSTFRYDFYANNSGTFYWHSHDGIQKLDGIQGNLVIRRPKSEEPNKDLYDYDLPAHVMFINDWYHLGAYQHFPGLITHDQTNYAYYYLINGRGRYNDKKTRKSSKTPYSIFRVSEGKKYRFRIVGGLCTQCPARLTFQDHKITIIATDGVPVKPTVVDSLTLFSGERYDVVLHADKKVKSYWIQVRGLEPCTETKATQVAVLFYEGSKLKTPNTKTPSYEQYLRKGLELNPINGSCASGSRGMCVTELETVEEFPPEILKDPDYSIPITFGYSYPTIHDLFGTGKFHGYLQPDPSATLIAWVNRIFETLPASPVLSQLSDVPKDLYCPTNATTKLPYCPENPDGYCDCLNIIKIPLHSVVQLILIDESETGGLNHPFHLHGYAFNVLAMGYLDKDKQNAEDIAKLIENKTLNISAAPVMKDTIAVPSVGYTVIRFVADNPGYWLFHCHFTHHHAVGMSVVIQIGEHEDNPPVPQGFQKCDNYVPPITTTWKI